MRSWLCISFSGSARVYVFTFDVDETGVIWCPHQCLPVASDLLDSLPTGSTANCWSDLFSATNAGLLFSYSVVLAAWKLWRNYGLFFFKRFNTSLRGLGGNCGIVAGMAWPV